MLRHHRGARSTNFSRPRPVRHPPRVPTTRDVTRCSLTVEIERPGDTLKARLGRLLKYLLRQEGIRCTDIWEGGRERCVTFDSSPSDQKRAHSKGT